MGLKKLEMQSSLNFRTSAKILENFPAQQLDFQRPEPIYAPLPMQIDRNVYFCIIRFC